MWALWVFGGLAVLVLAILSVPFDTVVYVDAAAEKKVVVRVTWLFGLIKKDITRKREKPLRKQETAGKKEGEKRKLKPDSISLWISRARGLASNVVTLVRDIFRQIRFGSINGYFTLGLDDPAETGILFAVISPINTALNFLPWYNVGFQPSFEDDYVFEGTLQGSARVFPILLTPPLLKFIFSREILGLGKTILLKRWKK